MDKFISATLLLALLHLSAAGLASEISDSSKSATEAFTNSRSANVAADQMRKPSSKMPNNFKARLTRPIPPTLSSDRPRLISPPRAKVQGE
jgi:hypothetical protein